LTHDWLVRDSGTDTRDEAQSVMNRSANGGPIILLVHDIEETRDGIEKLLKVDGYRVDSARYEDEAIATARRRGPKLIMVNLGGLAAEVIAAAHRIRDGAKLSRKVPVVIFCSEAVDEGDEIDLGSNVYVTRPDNFNQLRSFLRRLLGV
jgi:DNA-binding response OmpR family regulator